MQRVQRTVAYLFKNGPSSAQKIAQHSIPRRKKARTDPTHPHQTPSTPDSPSLAVTHSRNASGPPSVKQNAKRRTVLASPATSSNFVLSRTSQIFLFPLHTYLALRPRLSSEAQGDHEVPAVNVMQLCLIRTCTIFSYTGSFGGDFTLPTFWNLVAWHTPGTMVLRT